MKRKIWFISLLAAVFIFASVTGVSAAGYFNTDDVSKGLIYVSCNADGKLKVIIQKGDTKYTYDLNSAGVTETFPLQMGNGTYKISLFKNTSGTSYKLLGSTTVTVNMSKPNAVYLSSIQNINWTSSSLSVEKAVQLTSNSADFKEKAKILWDYMIKNNSYDYSKLANLSTGYIPLPDSTFIAKKGICYDFACLYAAMLRSQGVPAKLVKGYSPKYVSGYHAWNEVYNTDTGQWYIVDTTYDLQIFKKSAASSIDKNSSDFIKVYEY